LLVLVHELFQLYKGVESETNPAKLERFLKEKAIIDYIDPSESEDAFVAFSNEPIENIQKNKNTHYEIHDSLGYGMMGNQIIFPENNPPTRNSFSCGQSKQAVSLYHTNFQNRMDKSAVVLNSGQIPIVKSRYMEHINHEENPYGENTIVAIMCYTGYNVEDAILINEGSLKRGLFRMALNHRSDKPFDGKEIKPSPVNATAHTITNGARINKINIVWNTKPIGPFRRYILQPLS
jgi:DNA-directed RNA polymerase beta subunit